MTPRTATTETPKQVIGLLDPKGLSRFNDFRHLLPIKRTTVYKWVKLDKFPKPAIHDNNLTAWRNSDILAWLEKPTAWQEV